MFGSLFSRCFQFSRNASRSHNAQAEVKAEPSSKQDSAKQRSHKSVGNEGEQQAYEFLIEKGLSLIKRNFYSRFGEIDLIMLDKTFSSESYLVFIEVRHRKNSGYGSALESIHQGKQQKLKKTAQYFLLKNEKYRHLAARFDVIHSSPAGGKNAIEWLKNAF